MNLGCYAEYMRDPEFIGDTKVDLTEVLTKGETYGAFASNSSIWSVFADR